MQDTCSRTHGLQVARREHRRLKKSNEQHPGYAISRAYLETLADLPWDTFSGQKKDAQAKEADSDEQHDPGESRCVPEAKLFCTDMLSLCHPC